MKMTNMNTNRRIALTAAITLGLSCALGAQARSPMPSQSMQSSQSTHTTTTATGHDKISISGETQRDVNQQTRIEQGLKDGQLTTQEASQLEKGESSIEHTEQVDAHDGSMTQSEKSNLQAMQNSESQAIQSDKHNTVTGNPDSSSSKRLEQDVARDTLQEQRIHDGVVNGSLTNRETANLEGREAHTDTEQSRISANGTVTAAEQKHAQDRLDANSKQILDKKDNDSIR